MASSSPTTTKMASSNKSSSVLDGILCAPILIILGVSYACRLVRSYCLRIHSNRRRSQSACNSYLLNLMSYAVPLHVQNVSFAATFGHEQVMRLALLGARDLRRLPVQHAYP